MRLPLCLLALTLSAPALSQDAASIARLATAAGATDVVTRPAPSGGVTLNGRLEGDAFAIAIPPLWQGDGLVYARGYSVPGTPTAIDPDPVTAKTGGGLMRMAYDDGVAAGHSAYDKDGLAVESGTINTKRLRDFMMHIGAKRVYAAGDSMGGSIVVTLLETYPGAFAGGIARCGVVGSWQALLPRLYDMRAAYNVLTDGTPYALPGIRDVRRSALPATPSASTDTTDAAAKAAAARRVAAIATPILALWRASQRDPAGPEARIVRQVAGIGGYPVDPGALVSPLVTIALGADDMARTTGGLVWGNRRTVYRGPAFTAAEARSLNARIQRADADPAAIAYLRRWHEASGRLDAPLVTLHNRIDSLVPFSQEDILQSATRRAGRTAMLHIHAVPPTTAPVLFTDLTGYTHCGFSAEQTRSAWLELRHSKPIGFKSALLRRFRHPEQEPTVGKQAMR